MREINQDTKITGTQAWLLDNNRRIDGIKTYGDAIKLVTEVLNSRKAVNKEDRPREFKQIKEDLMKYFGFSKDEVKEYRGSSGYLNASNALQSLLVNTIIFLTNAKP